MKWTKRDSAEEGGESENYSTTIWSSVNLPWQSCRVDCSIDIDGNSPEDIWESVPDPEVPSRSFDKALKNADATHRFNEVALVKAMCTITRVQTHIWPACFCFVLSCDTEARGSKQSRKQQKERNQSADWGEPAERPSGKERAREAQ